MKTIYIRTNKINGKQYVGQTDDIKRRERDWRKLGSSYANKELDYDRANYGLDAWTIDILDEVDDSLGDETERKYIEKYNTMFPYGYNRYSGGIKGFTFEVSEKTKDKISSSTKGKHKSESTKQKISQSLKNHPHKSKQVYQYTLDDLFVAVYPSARQAARELGYSQGNISNCCNGGFYRNGKWVSITQEYGYKWSYKPL